MHKFIPVFILLALLLTLGVPACITTEREIDTPQTAVNSGGADDTLSLSPAPALSQTVNPSAMDISNAIADMVERLKPAVVFIAAKIETKGFFFNQTTMQTTSGSGAIISPEGYILTNNHVVEDAVELEVTLPLRQGTFKAEIVGTDPLTDLAVIKIEGNDFPTVPFGNTSTLRPGNLVVAMGYPLALEHGATITLGVISNTERSFTLGESTFYDVIQTDAAINPGNSGGPLVDLNGEVVGINSVLAGTAQNIGFAVSVNTAKQVYEALISDKHRVIRPWLGIQLQTVTPDLAIQADLSRQSGVVVAYVEDGSPADDVGLKVRDIITHLDGEEVAEATQLVKDLWRYEIGDEVSIIFWRDGQKKEVSIELLTERLE
ncbi:MAG: trypsin-like peptidase domain-containing protein [Chloroflexota bacterium]|nr:trypsin-like peptidase domain-containing protein [Chloroflexota bacterium]